MESVSALAESVQKFKGAVICVSHDQFFVQSVYVERLLCYFFVHNDVQKLTLIASLTVQTKLGLSVMAKLHRWRALKHIVINN